MVHPLLRTEPMAVPRRMLTSSALRAPIGSRRRRPAHLPPVNGPPPLQGVVASGTPPPRWTPPSFGRFVSVGRPAAPPYTSKGLPRRQGDSVPRSTVKKASTIRGTVASERRAPRDSISAKPSHAPVPVPTMRVLPARQRRRDDRRSCFRPSARRARDGAHAMPPPHPRAPAFATCRSRNVRRVLFRYP